MSIIIKRKAVVISQSVELKRMSLIFACVCVLILL